MFKVRGIGVAVSVSTSTSVRNALSFSLSRNAETVFLVDHHQAQVLEAHFTLQQPLSRDHDIDAARSTPARIPSASLLLRKRDRLSTRTGQSANLSMKVV